MYVSGHEDIFDVVDVDLFSVIALNTMVIDDVMRQLSFEETKLDGETGFADVARTGVSSSRLSLDESFDVGRTKEPLVAKFRTQETFVEEVRTKERIMKDVVLEDYFVYDDEGMDTAYKTEYDVQSSEYAEEEDVDVINADCFDNNPGNDDEINNYRKRMIRARCDGKVRVFTMSHSTRIIGLIGLNYGMEAGPSGSSVPNTRSKKGRMQIFDQVRVNPEIPVKAVQDQLQRKLEVQISMRKAFRAKAEREIK
nr:transposase, MuDR, MULE transposase domain protein [Tanacetum cinerariifolium]